MRTTIHSRCRGAVVLLVTLGACAASLANAAGIGLRTGSRLWLEGTSTIHEYSSTATAIHVSFALDRARWPTEGSEPETLEKGILAMGVESLIVAVDVSGMRSGKAALDRNMQRALKADRYSHIVFRLTGYEASAQNSEATQIRARGHLAVAGVVRPIELVARTSREGAALRMKGSVPLLMSDYGIKPPTMMMGTLRVADRVTVSFDWLVGAKEASTATP